MPSGEADGVPKPKYNVINGSRLGEKRCYQSRRISKELGTYKEKGSQKENKTKGKEIGKGKWAVPKDEIAKKEEVIPTPMFAALIVSQF